MPRKRAYNPELPDLPGLRLKCGTYYYDTGAKPRKWINLGRDRHEAVRRWAELDGAETPASSRTFRALWEKYLREVVPTKAKATQDGNKREAESLLVVFEEMDVADIKPVHVRQFLNARGVKAKVRATREKALLSHVLNKGREWGWLETANPCAGVKGWGSERDRYVTDEEFAKIHAAACEPLRDALDFALLTAQRPADCLKARRTDIRDGALTVQQGKTGKRLRIEVVGELDALLKRCAARAATAKIASLHLLTDERGRPLTYRSLNRRWVEARARAKVANVQFRDLRAKAATDMQDLALAQRLLGHQSRTMTEHYTKDRQGDKVRPLR